MISVLFLTRNDEARLAFSLRWCLRRWKVSLARSFSSIRERATGEWVAAFRARVLSAPSEENGLLISRAFYGTTGGHRPLAAMANVDLARRIGPNRLTILRARTMSRNTELRRSVTRTLRNAPPWRFLRFACRRG